MIVLCNAETLFETVHGWFNLDVQIFNPHPLSVLQASTRSDGPSRPESEASGGGAQQKPAYVPSTSRPPPQDVVRCQPE